MPNSKLEFGNTFSQTLVKNTLADERVASFLPLVKELSDEYDPQAIAAAALQMVYDQNCPQWMKGDWEVPDDSFNKPLIKKRGRGGYRKDRFQGKSGNRNGYRGKMRSGLVTRDK